MEAKKCKSFSFFNFGRFLRKSETTSAYANNCHKYFRFCFTTLKFENDCVFSGTLLSREKLNNRKWFFLIYLAVQIILVTMKFHVEFRSWSVFFTGNAVHECQRWLLMIIISSVIELLFFLESLSFCQIIRDELSARIERSCRKDFILSFPGRVSFCLRSWMTLSGFALNLCFFQKVDIQLSTCIFSNFEHRTIFQLWPDNPLSLLKSSVF